MIHAMYKKYVSVMNSYEPNVQLKKKKKKMLRNK